MSSAFDDRTSPKSPQRRPLVSVPPPAAEKVDLNQMFTLIDGILPFEACLYYQVLPLSVEGSRLNLGMVNPDDRGASDYVRRMLSYINCSLVSCEIPSDWHRSILSQYLSHNAQAKQQTQLTEKTSDRQSSLPESDSSSQQRASYPASAEAKKTTPSPVGENSAEANKPADNPAAIQKGTMQKGTTEPDLGQQNFRPTLIVDTPDQLDSTEDDNVLQQKITTVSMDETEGTLKVASLEQIETSPQQESAQSPLHFQVDSHGQHRPMDELAKLVPRELMHELLKRVIVGGIGRLYFERQANRGRILWSKDGVLQSVLENLKSSTFQGVINELKLLTRLSLTALHKPKQVEIERFYQGERILLRFRIMPGKNGEDATLQVLRGAALKFYQQQQIDKLSHDALGIAQKLQHQISQIRERGRQNLNLSVVRVETLPAIAELLKQMETQVQEIMLEQPELSQQNDDDDEG